MEATLRVLIVDDHGSMRNVLKKMLYQMGSFQVIEEANDGEEAWERLRTQSFDLVISDVNMPRLGGIGLLRRCRAENDLRDLPFLMISGDALPEIVASAGEWGAYDYVVKPFSFNVLKKRVEGILERWRSPEEALYREAEGLKEDGYADEALEVVEQFEGSAATLKSKWLNLKGECLSEVGRHDEALQYIEKAIQSCDYYLAAYKSYANLQMKLGNNEKAVEALEKADNLSPLDAERKITLGKMLMQGGRQDEGKKYLEKVLKMPSQEDKGANRMKVAEVYMENGHFAEAEELYVKALKENPEGIEALNRLGIALRRQGKFQEAENYYVLALKTFPNNAAIYYNLGVLYVNKQNKAKAGAYFMKCLELDPDFKEAERMLQSLKMQ